MYERPIDDRLLDDIRQVIQRGNRCEVIPVRDGLVRLYESKRHEVPHKDK